MMLVSSCYHRAANAFGLNSIVYHGRVTAIGERRNNNIPCDVGRFYNPHQSLLFASEPIEITDDDDDYDYDSNRRSSTSQSERSNMPIPPPPSTPEEELIQSWLSTHLPTLPDSDLQSYTSYLYNDGFNTLASLNSINSGNSGKVEDLYFMKKGHRRVLMKKIGIMKSVQAGNNQRLASRRGGQSTQQSVVPNINNSGRGYMSGNGKTKGEDEPIRNFDDSISSWLDEQNRLVEERRLARLAEEEEWKRKNHPLNTDGIDTTSEESTVQSSSSSSSSSSTAAGSGFKMASTRGEEEGQEEEDILYSKRYTELKPLPMDDHGTALKEARRLEALKRAFLSSRESASDFFKKNEKKKGWQYETRDSESSSPSSVTDEDVPPDFVLDDLAARYSSMDIDAMDVGTRNKELRRLEEIRKTFRQRASAHRNSVGYDVVSDDLSSRYSSLDIEAMDEGTRNKEARRLQGLRKEFRKKRGAYNTAEEEDEPIRLDLLKRQTREETPVERKERMRIAEFQRLTRLSAEKRGQRQSSRRERAIQQEELEDSVCVDDFVGVGSASQIQTTTSYKTNEKRRLEDLEKYFNKRRSTRMIADEDRLEKLLDAKFEALKDSLNTYDDDDNNLELDSFFEERPPAAARVSGARSLSTTMPPKGKGKESGVGVTKSSPSTKETDIDDYHDITVNNIEERENLSLSTTMPPTNRGPMRSNKKVVAKTTSGDEEECEIDDDECWDITRTPNFDTSRKSKSLATTLPPVNNENNILPNSIATVQDDGNYAYDVAKDSFPDSRGRTFLSQATASTFLTTTREIKKADVNVQKQKQVSLKTDSSIGGGESLKPNKQILDGMTAEEAEEIRNARLAASSVEKTILSPKPELERPLESYPAGFDPSQNFSKDRASLLGHLPRQATRTNGNNINPFSYSNDSSSKTNELAKQATGKEFLDVARVFQSNAAIDLSSNISSGRRFKRSRDVPLDEKTANQEYFDITMAPMPDIDGMAMTKISRKAAAVTENESSIPGGREMISYELEEEGVMQWLLTHLPNLQEADAIFYFNSLLEEGFDTVDILNDEICEEDLSFMKKGHQRVLLKSLRASRGDTNEEEGFSVVPKP